MRKIQNVKLYKCSYAWINDSKNKLKDVKNRIA
jgi:hypothetical protein